MNKFKTYCQPSVVDQSELDRLNEITQLPNGRSGTRFKRELVELGLNTAGMPKWFRVGQEVISEVKTFENEYNNHYGHEVMSDWLAKNVQLRDLKERQIYQTSFNSGMSYSCENLHCYVIVWNWHLKHLPDLRSKLSGPADHIHCEEYIFKKTSDETPDDLLLLFDEFVEYTKDAPIPEGMS